MLACPSEQSGRKPFFGLLLVGCPSIPSHADLRTKRLLLDAKERRTLFYSAEHFSEKSSVGSKKRAPKWVGLCGSRVRNKEMNCSLPAFNETCASILPLLDGIPHAREIIEAWVRLPSLRKPAFREKLERSRQRPRVTSFSFDPEPSKEIDSFLLFQGMAHSTRLVWDNGGFVEKVGQEAVTKVVDAGGVFSFVIENCGDELGYVVLGEVAPEFRGKGNSRIMLEAIHKIGFGHFGFTSIFGRAATPRGDSLNDWRSEPVVWKKHSETGNDIMITRLHKMWLETPYAVHGKFIIESLEDDSVAWLSPAKLEELDREDLRELDRVFPKKRKDSFVGLMRKRRTKLTAPSLRQ